MDGPGLVDIAIAPLNWLERSSGWKRVGLLFWYFAIALVSGLLAWQQLSLWRLPDIGEPFDVAGLDRVEVPQDSNAMVVYRRAAAKLIVPGLATYQPASTRAWDSRDWATADPEVRRWLVDNRPALSLWLEGTRRPDCLVAGPRDWIINVPRTGLNELRDFARLAMLEASRHEEAGDLEPAWDLLRSALRSSRHVGRHGGEFQRRTGLDLLELIQPPLKAWAEDPRATPAMLRRAIADVEDCRAMTEPLSEMFRMQYFLVDSALDRPETWRMQRPAGSPAEASWYGIIAKTAGIRNFLEREPERSRRVNRLVTAGLLAQCDRPRAERPPLASTHYLIYEVDSATPPAVAAMDPRELASWADRSGYSALAIDGTYFVTRIEGELAILDNLLLMMALRAFEAEHGRAAKTHGELLGTYLKALPPGVEPRDWTGAGDSPD